MNRKGNWKKKITAIVSAGVLAVTGTSSALSGVRVAAADLELDNYAKLLQYSLYFYDANMCGDEVGEKSAFSWRDDCHTESVVSGGFHDAGDGIQCGLTSGFTASTLGWVYYEYKDQFEKTGTDEHYKVIMNQFCQLFKDSTTLASDGSVSSLVYEMGDDGKDHGEWLPPEDMGSYGSDQTYSTSSGASNVAAQYAAALAQNYINFGDEEDLKYAKALYEFAAKYRTVTYDQSTYSEQISNCQDDISWAAGWMYLATGKTEDSYLTELQKYTSVDCGWTDDYFYGNVKLGAAILNAEITNDWSKSTQMTTIGSSKQQMTIGQYIDAIVNQNQNQFYVMSGWGSARHNTLMQICAMVVTKYKEQSGKDYSEWCKKQMNMILGDNNANVCLVVGYNDYSATSPHHRAASNLKSGSSDGWNAYNSWDGDYASSNGHTLYGALCGGPGSTDFSTYQKTAKDATSNEVALDYQVGLVGAAAGLYAYYGTGSVVATIGDEVTVYPSEVAVANGETPTPTTTTQPTETTTTEELTETTTTETETVTEAETTSESTEETTETELSEETTVTTTTAAEETTTETIIETETETEAVTTVATESKTTTTETEKSGGDNATLYGDVNLDGRVDITDAVKLNKACAGSVSLEGDAVYNADCNGSGTLETDDAVILLQFLVSIVKSLPHTN